LGLVFLLLIILSTIRLNRISNSTGVSAIELGVCLSIITAIGYSIIFFVSGVYLKTKDIDRKQTISVEISFLLTLALVYFSIGFWHNNLVPYFFAASELIASICLFFIHPLLFCLLITIIDVVLIVLILKTVVAKNLYLTIFLIWVMLCISVFSAIWAIWTLIQDWSCLA
jgi:hypothetical protein